MIRPLTILTCLMACGSGLYLYQSKHEVQMLDRTIEKTVRETTALREQSRLLAAEWTMLNDPQRLQNFATTYLTLQPIAPPQFTRLADLDSRLPPVQPEAPAHGPDEQNLAPVVSEGAPTTDPNQIAADQTGSDQTAATDADTGASTTDAVVADALMPLPPVPTAPPPVVASVERPADAWTAGRPTDIRSADRVSSPRPTVQDSQSRPVTVADAHPYDRLPEQRQRSFDQRGPDQRPTIQRTADTRPDMRTPFAPPPRPIVLVASRPMPVSTRASLPPRPYRQPASAPSAPPFTGSLLGMARGSMPPAPRPMPMNAAYDAN